MARPLSLETFVRRYGGHDALTPRLVFKLPVPLVGAIHTFAPDFLSTDELKFEKDLARLPGVGLWNGAPFSYAPLDAFHASVLTSAERRRQKSASSEIEKLLAEEMKAAGRNRSQIDRYRTVSLDREQKLRERQRGFVGWLLTEPSFLDERDTLVATHHNRIVEDGEWPTIPHSFEPSPTVPVKSRRFSSDSQRFLNRWCLEGLVAAELPRPLKGGLVDQTGYARNALQEGGLTLFAPWFLFADHELTLRDIVEHQLGFGGQDHLRGWMSGRDSKFGHQRYGKLLILYVYLHRALYERYGTTLRQNTSAIDAAFAAFLDPQDVDGSGAEAVRKVRRKLKSRLKACD